MNDQYEGMGGSYRVDEEGGRKLISRTEETPPVNPEPDPPDQPETVAPTKTRQKAGFFTPVDPVTPADTTTTTTE